MQRVKFTTLTGERWPGAASWLLFGVRSLKIMNTNLLPLPPSLSCSHLYAFCSGSELLFVVCYYCWTKNFLSLCVCLYAINFLRNKLGFPEISDLKILELRGFLFFYIIVEIYLNFITAQTLYSTTVCFWLFSHFTSELCFIKLSNRGCYLFFQIKRKVWNWCSCFSSVFSARTGPYLKFCWYESMPIISSVSPSLDYKQ